MDAKFSVAKVDNGYILKSDSWVSPRHEIFKTLDEVLARLLMVFEGRCESFGGQSYGKVRVYRECPEESTPTE